MRFRWTLLLSLFAVLAFGCGPDDRGTRIAVIPKGETHLFWKAVRKGAERAGREFEVEILWKGPLQENDRAGQIQIVQQRIRQRVSGIALAPLDNQGLVDSVKLARDSEIPVVIFDSALDGRAGEDFLSFIASDNLEGGRMAGEHMAKLLGGQGKVVMLRYDVGHASTTNREKGFVEALSRYEGITITVDNRYARGTAETAKTETLNLADQLRAADGCFAPNESSAYGMLMALEHLKLAGQIKYVGFDASPPLVDGLRQGHIDALVVQDPVSMGYESVKALALHIRDGQTPRAEMKTTLAVVTRDNIEQPEIKALVQ